MKRRIYEGITHSPTSKKVHLVPSKRLLALAAPCTRLARPRWTNRARDEAEADSASERTGTRRANRLCIIPSIAKEGLRDPNDIRRYSL